MDSDIHCHTVFSDGAATVDEMVAAAVDIGLRSIAVTDHVRRDTPWLDDYLEEIESLKERYDGTIEVLSGFETKVVDFDGLLDVEERRLEEVDVVLGSIHSIPSAGGFLTDRETADRGYVLSCWLHAFRGLVRNDAVHVIAHPAQELAALGIDLDEEMEDEVVDMIVRENKIVEVSLRHRVPGARFFAKLLDRGVPMAVGSDAHSVEDMYRCHRGKRRYLEDLSKGGVN
ncbi:MAG TPA: PHP domain-containing protein [Deltaproteobacteria bacterium]|nr:PHP domain-containing protein [Deltaproteobacteria bacterium]